MVKWPFQGVKWPPTRGWKGHFESPGYRSFGLYINHYLPRWHPKGRVFLAEERVFSTLLRGLFPEGFRKNGEMWDDHVYIPTTIPSMGLVYFPTFFGWLFMVNESKYMPIHGWIWARGPGSPSEKGKPWRLFFAEVVMKDTPVHQLRIYDDWCLGQVI